MASRIRKNLSSFHVNYLTLIAFVAANAIIDALCGPLTQLAIKLLSWFQGMPLILPKSDSIQICEVWNDNLEEEFALIREIVDDYPYIAMDTEFPGIVLRPMGNFKNNYDYHYQTLTDNVDMLKLIQLGLTFSDEHDNLPTCASATDAAFAAIHRRRANWIPVIQMQKYHRNYFTGSLPAKCFKTWKAMMVEDHDVSKLNRIGSEVLSYGGIYYQDSVTLTIKGLQLEFVKVLNLVTSIDFSSNNFDGIIPEELMNFTGLYALNFSHNGLTGRIPSRSLREFT